MAKHLYLATQEGVSVAGRENGTWRRIERVLGGHHVTSITACQDLIIAGTRDGIWRSTDRGRTWQAANRNLTIRHIRWLACIPEDNPVVLAGTEPAGIFVSRDRVATWIACPEVESLRDSHGWMLPYSPAAGCIRGFAVTGHGADASRMFAAVEVGGVLVSNDYGHSWQLVKGSDGNPDIRRDLDSRIHPDVHSLTVHPSSADFVTAATGGGLYRSRDGGQSWRCLYTCYCRAVWVDPADADHIIFGPADGVSRNGRIEESRDGGNHWQPTSTDMAAPWRRHMVERFVEVDSELMAVLSNGQLWSMGLDHTQWLHLLRDSDHITAAAAGS